MDSLIDEQSLCLGRIPNLSIVVPAYNVAPYIAAAVNSALDQTYANLEVIVVNDGSTDDTLAIVEGISKQRGDPRLRIITQSNGGLSAARNTGIEKARGEFIGFLDGDDLWAPSKAARHYEALRADPGLGISFSYSEYLREDGSHTGSILHADCPSPSLHRLIRRNHIGNGSTPVVRRACFDSVGGFREDLKSCEDYEQWCRILWGTEYRAEVIPLPLTYYRLRNTSLSFNFEKFLDNAELAMSVLKARMKNVPESVFRAGQAEHYRIAAWKAASTGQDTAAGQLLLKAFRIHPQIILSDLRVVGTAVMLALPVSWRSQMAKAMKFVRLSIIGSTTWKTASRLLNKI